MCGVAAFQLDNVTQSDLELVKRVLIETQIRGRHASGIAWFDGNSVQCVKDSVPMSELVNSISLDSMLHDGDLAMIAHCRYSTSDLEFNQPLGDENFMIAHNGVITQSSPDTWESTYGHTFSTRNDSEILLHTMAQASSDRHTSSQLSGSSISVVRIDNSGSVSGFTNGLRPLWRTTIESGTIYTSTKDIMTRASNGLRVAVKVPVVYGCEDRQVRHM